MSGTLAIPASDIVNIIPSVLGGGGNALDLSGLILTATPLIPPGTVVTYPSQAAVAAVFGATSQEATLAGNYFLGFAGATATPGAILFAQYNQAAVGAWVRGGSVISAGMTLAQLQALTGTIIVTINGTPYTSSPINLTSATSFTAAAELMSIAIGLVGSTASIFTGSITGTVLTVTAISSGTISLNQEVRGSGVAAGTQIAAFGTGTGGLGTYTVTNLQTVSSGAMTSVNPTITYEPISGAFKIFSPTTGTGSTISYATGTLAAAILLTQATGAVISQGANAASPSAFMAGVTVQTQNWAAFTTTFDPDAGSGNTIKQQFAKWVNSTNNRYVYAGWDTDITPTLSLSAPTSLGAILNAANSGGSALIWSPTQGPTIASFLLGAIAAVDFAARNGRVTFMFRSQQGLTADVTNQTVKQNLVANGYNFYGTWATANQTFTWLAPGQITGAFNWLDSYTDQIWLNNQLQLAMMDLFQNIPRIPYNADGIGLVRGALLDPINAALNFGAITTGVSLSAAQIAEVNSAVGLKIDTALTNQGWYLQIKLPTVQVQAARGTFPCSLFYMDGEACQSLTLGSVLIE